MPMFRTLYQPMQERDLHTSGLNVWTESKPVRPVADPDTLARLVQDHKRGDAMAQAVLSLTLMLAIGAVAVVLSVEGAAAASLAVRGVMGDAATFTTVALVGGSLLAAWAILRRVAQRPAADQD